MTNYDDRFDWEDGDEEQQPGEVKETEKARVSFPDDSGIGRRCHMVLVTFSLLIALSMLSDMVSIKTQMIPLARDESKDHWDDDDVLLPDDDERLSSVTGESFLPGDRHHDPERHFESQFTPKRPAIDNTSSRFQTETTIRRDNPDVRHAEHGNSGFNLTTFTNSSEIDSTLETSSEAKMLLRG